MSPEVAFFCGKSSKCFIFPERALHFSLFREQRQLHDSINIAVHNVRNVF